QVDEEPESFAVVTTVATNTSTPENASNFADKADATVTKTATSTISPTETSTKSPTPTTTATRTPRPSQTPEPTDTPTALPTAVFIASSATPVPQAATTSLRTPDVYPGDVSLSINPSGSQFSSGTNFRICVGMEGIDFNKAGVTAIGGYRIVENDTIGDFITLFNYNASSPLQNGCTGNDITFTNSGFYEVWGFVCTNEYDCTGGEGWESSEPILITITE
ncbi:MAG: hypothetical protein KC419_10765, partial [Anaerolineales bacterium]|nr:hypothetical protein [Anaerolineales bacterium]